MARDRNCKAAPFCEIKASGRYKRQSDRDLDDDGTGGRHDDLARRLLLEWAKRVVLGVEQLVAFRIHGVSPEFTEDIQKLVEKNISSDDLVAFRIHGVSPEFVRSMKDAGYAKISPDQLVAMRIHGVDADFVKEVRAHGYKDPSIDDLRISGHFRSNNVESFVRLLAGGHLVHFEERGDQIILSRP